MDYACVVGEDAGGFEGVTDCALHFVEVFWPRWVVVEFGGAWFADTDFAGDFYWVVYWLEVGSGGEFGGCFDGGSPCGQLLV